MSIRALWIVNPPTGKVLFTRRYPTVERRAKLVGGTGYVPLLDDARLIPLLIAETEKQFKATKQSCDAPDDWPVCTLANGDVWPMVVIREFGLYFACLPLVETPGLVKTPLVELPSVTLSVALLQDIAKVAENSLLSDQSGTAANELYSYLCLALPFGSPLDTSLTNVKSLLGTKFSNKPPTEKQPAWKPVLFKGKQQIRFSIAETVRAVQYDNPAILDEWEAYGTIFCKAEIEGVPEVTVSLSSTAGIDQISVDPCVLSNNDAQVSGGSSAQASILSNRKLSFAPPLENFPLCHYKASGIKELPIRGFYQMKEVSENAVKILVQLKLHAKVNNAFEYCEVRIPFFNRGIVRSIDSAPTSGTIALTPSRRILVWNIGQKFTGRNLEVSLSATVYFTPQGVNQQSEPSEALLDKEYSEDPFCAGPNAFIDVHFKISDFVLSGCTIDPKSIVLYPANKIKATITRDLMSALYRIWNSLGEAKVTVQPPLMS